MNGYLFKMFNNKASIKTPVRQIFIYYEKQIVLRLS